MGLRRRNRLLDLEKLLWLLRTSDVEQFRKHLEVSLQERIAQDQMKREAKWTESIAVGGQDFVERLEAEARNRQRLEVVAEDGTWMLRECYESIMEGQNRAIARFEGVKYV